jgi:RimJ/RimL family protein N-acetyltransferase
VSGTAVDGARRLETERLVLTVHEAHDFEDLAAMWADPEVVRHIGGTPSSREASWHRLLRYAGHWALTGYGYFAMRERHSGRYVGDIGLADFRRDLVPAVDGGPEAGWALATWAHGRGLATEALTAVLAWADARLAAPATMCLIDVGHAASRRVAEKCGFREWMAATYHGEVVTLFRRARGGPS